MGQNTQLEPTESNFSAFTTSFVIRIFLAAAQYEIKIPNLKLKSCENVCWVIDIYVSAYFLFPFLLKQSKI